MGLSLPICLALIHLFVSKVSGLHYLSHRRWISLASGVSIAYIFLDVFPEMAQAQEKLEHSSIPLLAYVEQHVYLLALFGLILFYGLDYMVVRARYHPQLEVQVDAIPLEIFWIHIGAFGLYNTVLGYLVYESTSHGLRASILLFITLGLHFVVNDLRMREAHKHSYDHFGRWLLAAAILVGWGVGHSVMLAPAIIAGIWAIVAGGVILIVLREELPQERESDFLTFLVGVLGYGVLLLFGR